jgi:septum formation protein
MSRASPGQSAFARLARAAGPSGGIAPQVRAELILASQSPRRRELLTDAGVRFSCLSPAIDDADVAHPGPGVTPGVWAMSLAYFKARLVAGVLPEACRAGAWVLSADTLVVLPGIGGGPARVLGKPADADEARAMIRDLADGEHQVVTGVCLLRADLSDRHMAFDVARVTFGPLAPDVIERYARGGAWAGKAGGYNLPDRVLDGWNISVVGDETCVMGLPMGVVMSLLLEHCPGVLEGLA